MCIDLTTHEIFLALCGEVPGDGIRAAKKRVPRYLRPNGYSVKAHLLMFNRSDKELAQRSRRWLMLMLELLFYVYRMIQLFLPCVSEGGDLTDRLFRIQQKSLFICRGPTFLATLVNYFKL